MIANAMQRKFVTFVQYGDNGTANQIMSSAQTNQQFLQQFQSEWVDWNAIYNMTQSQKDKLLWEIDNGIYVNVPIL